MKTWKLLTMLLAVILIIGLLPVTAFAGYYGDVTISDGSGTSFEIKNGAIHLFAPAGYQGTEILTTEKGKFGYSDAKITWTVKSGTGTLTFGDYYILHDAVWIEGSSNLKNAEIAFRSSEGAMINVGDKDTMTAAAALHVTDADLTISSGSSTNPPSFNVYNFQTQYAIAVEGGSLTVKSVQAAAGAYCKNANKAAGVYVPDGNVLIDVNSRLTADGSIFDKNNDLIEGLPAYAVFTNESLILDGDLIVFSKGAGASPITASEVRLGYGLVDVIMNENDKKPVFSVNPAYVDSSHKMTETNGRLVYEYTGAIPASSDFSKYTGSKNNEETAPTPEFEFTFTDVPTNAWHYQDVFNATKMGLINGVSKTKFNPDGSMTYAEAVKLAACMNQLYNDGKVTLKNAETGKWYDSYMAYALKNGIIAEDFSGKANTAISREEYVSIFYKALPETAYSIRNSIADNVLPDVKISDKYADEIYTFYRAGILTGNNSAGMFAPDSSIKRSEVAAILIRMMDDTSRMDVKL